MDAQGGELTVSHPSRRTVLGLVAGATGAVVLGGCTPEPEPIYTVERWRAERGERFMIGHRGSGDVRPEHTLEAYQAAIGWGARAIEISVVGTSDGVLICQHDLSYNRTTNREGPVVTQTSSVLVDARVTVPRLGPRWNGKNAPPIARLTDVLRRIGGQAVLIIEAKDDAVFTGIQRAIADRELQKSVVVKLHQNTQRIPQAHDLGYPVFCYFGTADEMTPKRIDAVAAQLDPKTDYLVIPANDDKGTLPDPLLEMAKATQLPVWVHPVHRRWEVEHFYSRGVQAIVASSYGYLAGTIKPVSKPAWDVGELSPGELTRRPEAGTYGLEWPEPGVARLAVQGKQAFVTLGYLAPLAQPKGPYVVDFEMRVDTSPKDPFTNLSFVFGHEDDSYYEHLQGTQDGYHAMIRMTGAIELRRHDAGTDEGALLGSPKLGPTLVPGRWVPLRVEVGPETIVFTRVDTGQTVSVKDAAYRGSYMHIGRSSTDGTISLRRLQISQTSDSPKS